MGVMKRLYQRDGKGLPTDGPTVLRGPRPTKPAKAAPPPAPEPGPSDRWAAERAEITPASQPGWWRLDGGYLRQRDVIPEKWAAWGLPPHPAEVAAKPKQLTLF